jgi:hypothetical protein
MKHPSDFLRTTQRRFASKRSAALGNKTSEEKPVCPAAEIVDEKDAFKLWLTSYRDQLEGVCERLMNAERGAMDTDRDPRGH